MKSILQEAPSVAKAVEKGWRAAGMPEEFTVKVFEIEKKNFFGFVSSPAVVSIIYDPRKIFKGTKEKDINVPIKHEEPSYQRPKKSYQQSRESYQQPRERYNSKGNDSQSDYNHHHQEQQYQSYKAEGFLWQPDMLMDVTRWLKDILELLKVQSKFDYEVDEGLLKIEFERPVVAETEYEQMLFASFAHLLLQLLKKKYRNQFRGIKILISSNR